MICVKLVNNSETLSEGSGLSGTSDTRREIIAVHITVTSDDN